MRDPKNQHAQVLWYLYNWKSFDLFLIIRDSMFYKFQTRLSDIEREKGTIAKRKRISFTNRFGRKSSYYEYSPIDKDQIKQLYSEYNK